MGGGSGRMLLMSEIEKLSLLFGISVFLHIVFIAICALLLPLHGDIYLILYKAVSGVLSLSSDWPNVRVPATTNILHHRVRGGAVRSRNMCFVQILSDMTAATPLSISFRSAPSTRKW